MTKPGSKAGRDVRMQGFAKRHTVEAALAWLDVSCARSTAELVPLAPPRAACWLPLSSAMSMFPVSIARRWTAMPLSRIHGRRDRRTTGCTLTVVGDALPGLPVRGGRHRGEAVRIMTGAPMPAGADAVLPAEFAEVTGESPDQRRRALDGVARQERRPAGRRHRRGTTMLDAGRVLRPQDLGVLSSIGLAEARVIRRPRVRLVITGNELLPAGSRPHGFQIADANGPMLAALVERDGGLVDFPGLVRDDRDAILAALQADADVVIVSGGSSVGIEDLAPMLVATHGELAVHGIAMRPSSPTGLGRLGHRLVFLLPGNPVSACAPTTSSPAARSARWADCRKAWPYRSVRGHARPQDQLADRPPRLRPRQARRRTRRAARRRRRIGAVVDDARRRVRHRWRRQRRLRRRRRS